MKKLFAFVLLLSLLSGMACAQAKTTYLSVTQLKEATPQRWTQTYETKWRTVEIDVQLIVPDVDAFPILKVTPDFDLPDLSQLGEGWTYKQYDDGIFNLYLNEGGAPEVLRAQKKSGASYVSTHYFPPYDFDRVYAENSDFTLRDVIEEMKRLLIFLGMDPENWWYERPIDLLCNRTTNKKTGKYLIEGDYSITLEQKLSGIPLLRMMVDRTVKRNMKDEIGYNTVFSFDIRSTDAIALGWQSVKTTEVLSEDVPLCDFALVQAALEKEIKAGHIRKIFDVDLVYGLYSEKGIVRAADHPKGVIYYALPVWRVNCYYVNSATKKLKDYSGLDVPERGVIEYTTLLVDAQSGKLIDREKKGSGDYDGFISWEKAGGKK